MYTFVDNEMDACQHVLICNTRDASDMGERREHVKDIDSVLSGDVDTPSDQQSTEGEGGQTTKNDPVDMGSQQVTGEQGPVESEPDNSATPGAEASGGRQVPLAALKDERHKRQELDKKLRKAELELARFRGRQEVAAQQQQVAQKEEEFSWNEDKVLEDLPGAFTKMEQRMEQKLREQKYKMSHAAAQNMFPDYEEVMGHLEEAARELPHLGATVEQADMPAIYAYKTIKEHLERKNQPQNDSERIEAEVKKRLDEEIAKIKGEMQSEGVPQPLASARGSGAGTAANAGWSGPTPFKTLFNGR